MLTGMLRLGSFQGRYYVYIEPGNPKPQSSVSHDESKATSGRPLTKYAAGITVPKNPTNSDMLTNQNKLCFIAWRGMKGVFFGRTVSIVRRVRQRAIPMRVVPRFVHAMILVCAWVG